MMKNILTGLELKMLLFYDLKRLFYLKVMIFVKIGSSNPYKKICERFYDIFSLVVNHMIKIDK